MINRNIFFDFSTDNSRNYQKFSSLFFAANRNLNCGLPQVKSHKYMYVCIIIFELLVVYKIVY